MMEFEGEFTCDGTPEELWKYFTDPDILLDSAPGCDELTCVSPSELTATLSVGVGSVKPTFDVDALVVECDRPNRLEIRASGTASRNSFEVSAWQELSGNGDGTTTVTWKSTAEVSGIIASMGERALGSVAKKLVNEFFQNLEDHVNAGTEAESKFEAASQEQLEAAGYATADADDEAESSSAGPAPDLSASSLQDGSPASPLPVSPDKKTLALAGGAALGGVLLWRRARSGDDDATEGVADEPADEHEADQPAEERTGQTAVEEGDEHEDDDGGRNWLRYLVLGATAAVVAKLLWDRFGGGGSDVQPSAPSDVGIDETGSADATGVPSGESGNGTASAVATTGGSTDSVTASGDGDAADGYFDENPLDRLESRYQN